MAVGIGRSHWRLLKLRRLLEDGGLAEACVSALYGRHQGQMKSRGGLKSEAQHCCLIETV